MMPTFSLRPFVAAGFTAFLLYTSEHSAFAQSTSHEGSDQGSKDKQICVQHLNNLYQAIQAYRRDHKELPNWLSDLYPDYLQDQNILACPVTQRTGRVNTYGVTDPKMTTSYVFEFCAQEVPNVIWGGEKMTMRGFKSLQMALVGGDTPILRCHQHDPVLNISFDGKFYESPVTWESRFYPVVNGDDLSPSALKTRFKIADTGNPNPAMVPKPIGSESKPSPTDAEVKDAKTPFKNLVDRLFARTPTPPPPRPVESAPEKHPLTGKPAPDFTLDLLEAGTFTLSEHRGKHIVLLDFWATWCGPCRMAMPILAEVAKEYHDQGVRYYAVDLKEESETVRQYLKNANLNLSVPLDKTGEVAKQYGVLGIPTMAIVDKQGVVSEVHVGFSPDLKQQLKSALDGIIKGAQVTDKTGTKEE